MCMDRKPKVQTRMPADLKDRLDEYQESRDISQADAVRRLVRVGLDREQQAVPDGGAVMTRLEQIETKQEQITERRASTQRRQTTGIIVGLAYIAVTIVTGASGILWSALGAVLLFSILSILVVRA